MALGNGKQRPAAVGWRGFIARAAANSGHEKLDAAQRSAEGLLERLMRGESRGETPLKPLPPFELTRGQGEPELEAALFGDLRSRQWQGPIRTRPGWVIARTTDAITEGTPSPELESEARKQATARRRQAEERRISGELRESATIVRQVRLGPSP